MTPAELVAFLNEYLSAMTDIIESKGGYIDKYIGDFIVAVFGAPADDPDHATNAAHAALACRARLDELNQTSTAFSGHKVAHRMGLNSGAALVGNIGSRRRFNYSVMSDAVNLASRLEGANKFYGTTIAASDMTVTLTGSAFVWRELDAMRVQGRITPVRIYELVAEAGQQTPQQAAAAAAYAEGLAHWRNREFDAAAKCFERTAGVDKPSALFLRRARTPFATTRRVRTGNRSIRWMQNSRRIDRWKQQTVHLLSLGSTDVLRHTGVGYSHTQVHHDPFPRHLRFARDHGGAANARQRVPVGPRTELCQHRPLHHRGSL